MKKIKSLLSVILVASILLGVLSISASASVSATSPINGGVYYIQHVGSGKYWDITDESTANGARLQIWSKYPQHQNQVFYFNKVGNYWKITAYNSNKVIEVRNNSTSNNAEVAQWDYVGISSQQWSIICNSDGTVSFKNRNSGKFIDVSGNGSANGTKMIQYQSNGTKAQKFRLYKLCSNDIYSATWTRNLSNSDIVWTKKSSNDLTINCTNYSKSGYYPRTGYSYLTKVEYIDPKTVDDIKTVAARKKSTLRQLSNLVFGDISEEFALNYLEGIGIYTKPIIYAKYGVGILEILSNVESDKDWNRFIDATEFGKGIKKTTYVTFKTVVYGSTNYGISLGVKEVYTYEYSAWDGNSGISIPGYSGYWNYCFK